MPPTNAPSTAAEAWFSPRDLAAPGVRLFCLPHAGSGAAAFYQWKRFAPAALAICPVLLPGRDARIAETPLTSLRDTVECLTGASAALLERPYAIFGHSLGSLLAFEWTRAIQARGLRLPRCLFLSGRAAPHLDKEATSVHLLEDAAFLTELQRRYGGSHAALLEDAELRSVFLPVLRADLVSVETYRCTPAPPLECPVRAFAGEEDHSVATEGLLAWQDLAGPDFCVERFPGGHFYTLGDARAALLQTIAAAL